ncbi:MAG: hypothetical protein ACHQ1H_11280 [Nitrososphaerales archaeon]
MADELANVDEADELVDVIVDPEVIPPFDWLRRVYPDTATIAIIRTTIPANMPRDKACLILVLPCNFLFRT